MGSIRAMLRLRGDRLLRQGQDSAPDGIEDFIGSLLSGVGSLFLRRSAFGALILHSLSRETHESMGGWMNICPFSFLKLCPVATESQQWRGSETLPHMWFARAAEAIPRAQRHSHARIFTTTPLEPKCFARKAPANTLYHQLIPPSLANGMHAFPAPSPVNRRCLPPIAYGTALILLLGTRTARSTRWSIRAPSTRLCRRTPPR